MDRAQRIVALGACVLAVGSCTMIGSPELVGPTASGADRAAAATPRAEPPSRRGNMVEYEQFGAMYRVLETSRGYEQEGMASWYGKSFHGRATSSGERFDMNRLSAAHRTLPLPSWVEGGHEPGQRAADRAAGERPGPVSRHAQPDHRRVVRRGRRARHGPQRDGAGARPGDRPVPGADGGRLGLGASGGRAGAAGPRRFPLWAPGERASSAGSRGAARGAWRGPPAATRGDGEPGSFHGQESGRVQGARRAHRFDARGRGTRAARPR